MQVDIEVNGQILTTRKGNLLLEVLNQNGIRVPTLCSMDGFAPTGACRLCVVEIEGVPDLVPACSFTVNEPVHVRTHSARVIQARRAIVELLISSHPDDCLYCFQNRSCELLLLASELQVTERKGRRRKMEFKTDRSSPALSHDASKCLLCGRCIRICDQLKVSALEFVSRGQNLRVGTNGNKGLNHSSCIACGQCIQSCPSGSLQEKIHLEDLLRILQQGDQSVIGIIDSSIAVSISEEMGFRAGKDVSEYLYAALRKMGFQSVYSGTEAVDLTVFHAAELWHKRVLEGLGPAILPFCPSTLNYLEKIRPDLLPHVLPLWSPSQSFARLLKRKNPDIRVVYFTACIASKMEREKSQNQSRGKAFVDFVMSSRELIQMIKLFGVEFDRMSPEVPDYLIQAVPFSKLITAVSGGWLEAINDALGVLYPMDYMQDLRRPDFRGIKACKSQTVTTAGPSERWTACSALGEGIRLLEDSIKSKTTELFELMACPGGCINGGGQAGPRTEKSIRSRIKEIYNEDRALSGQVAGLIETSVKLNQELPIPHYKANGA